MPWRALEGRLGVTWSALVSLGMPRSAGALECLGALVPWRALECLGVPWSPLERLGVLIPWFASQCLGVPWSALDCLGRALAERALA